MTRLRLVRHGRASAGWNVDPDPGLDDMGREQADRVARRLQPLPSVSIVTSPLRRCQETAGHLARLWDCVPTVDDAVAEIPSPDGVPMAERVDWLRVAMQGTWADLGGRYVEFRDQLVARLVAMPSDTIVFSHFVAINAAIGAATSDDRLVIASLDNCSVTTVDVIEGALHLVEVGAVANTLIR